MEETDKAGKKLVWKRKDLIFIDNPETRPMAQEDTGVGRRGASTQEVRPESVLDWTTRGANDTSQPISPGSQLSLGARFKKLRSHFFPSFSGISSVFFSQT